MNTLQTGKSPSARQGSGVRPIDTVRELCVLGPRPAGSDANAAAASIIAARFENAGLAVERQPFDCTAWSPKSVRLEVDGEPAQGGIAVHPFSPSCSAEGAILVARSPEELERLPMEGRIAVLAGELAREPYFPSAFPYFTMEEHERVVRALKKGRPAAILVIAPDFSRTFDGRVLPPEPRFEDPELLLSGATLGAELAPHILGRSDVRARVEIVANLASAETANVVARTAEKKERRILFCAHYDTKPFTPGAWDNASGAAVLLELAARLPKRYPQIGFEFVAFTSEESMPIGEVEYLRRLGLGIVPSGAMPPERSNSPLGDLELALNIDGVGQIVGSPTACVFNDDTGKLAAAIGRIMGPQWSLVDPWPQSNHSTFASQLVPTVAIGWKDGVPLQHGAADTPNWIDTAALEDVADFCGKLVQEIGN